MSELIAAALPYAFAAMLAAPAVLVVSALIIAGSRTPALSAWVFVGGAALLDVLVAAVIYVLLEVTGASGDGDVGAALDVVIGAVFLLLGVAAWRSEESPEKRAANRERIEKVATGRLRNLLIAGVVVQIINSDALVLFTGAVKAVALESPAAVEAIVAIGISIAVMLVPYYLPALAYAISPQGSRRLLQPINEWILDDTRLLEMVLGFAFGIGFLVKGIQGLS